MSLEANKFNISIDDQYQQQLYLIEMIKDVNRKYTEEIKEDNTIEKSLLSRFKTLYNNFTYELFDLVSLVDNYVQDTDRSRDDYLDYNLYTPQLADKINNVIYSWNNLVIFLVSKLQYQDLNKTNKSYIDGKLTQLSPSVLKIVKNFKYDVKKGYAHVTSQNYPSNLLFSNLDELADKLSQPDISLIKFKGDIGEDTPLEKREGEEEGEEEAEDDEIGEAMRYYIEGEPEEEQEEEQEEEPEEDDGGFGFLLD